MKAVLEDPKRLVVEDSDFCSSERAVLDIGTGELVQQSGRVIQVKDVLQVVIGCKKVDTNHSDNDDYQEPWLEYRFTVKLVVVEPASGRKRQLGVLSKQRPSLSGVTEPSRADLEVAHALAVILGFTTPVAVVTDDLLDEVELHERSIWSCCLPDSVTGRSAYEKQYQTCEEAGVDYATLPVQTRCYEQGVMCPLELDTGGQPTGKSKKKDRAPKEQKAKPLLRIDSDGKYLRPLDEKVQEFFDKYDLDVSGSMNSHTEIRQLTTNLLASALKIREFKAGAIKEEIAKLPENTDWSIDQYKEWFFATFKFSKLRLDEVPETQM